jgi:integrase
MFIEEADKVVHRNNYLWVKQYLKYLGEVHGLTTDSVGRYWFHLRHLLLWANSTPLPEAAKVRPTLQQYVNQLPGKNGQGILASETRSRIVETANRFFSWAKVHLSKEFQRISPAWIDELQVHLPEDGEKEHVYTTYEEILQIARLSIRANDLALKRDQAAAVMLFLSGMRAAAFTSAPIKAFDLDRCCVYQWPNEFGVHTKNSKKSTTHLLRIQELLAVVRSWDQFVRAHLPDSSPWYTPINNEWGEHRLSDASAGKNSGQRLDKRLRILFAAAGLPYKSAHKFRHGHAVFGLQHATTMAAYKAVSMNLMHADIKTTDSIYARLLNDEVGQQIAALTQGE